MDQRLSQGASTVALGLAGIAVGGLLVRWIRRRLEPRDEAEAVVFEPIERVWQAWTSIVGLSRFLRHVDRVEDLGGGRARWTARLADGSPLQWETEETERVEGHLIRWRTIDDQPVRQYGEIRFEAEPYGGSTLVRLSLGFLPVPEDHREARSFLKSLPERLAREELDRFVAWVESDRTARELAGPPVAIPMSPPLRTVR